MIHFENDELGYFAWLSGHPNGFVLNVREWYDPSYVVLHRASCGSISSLKVAEGAYTERDFNKWCADTVDSLRTAAKREGRADGSFSQRCGRCRP
jgi:hypothetical protein